MKTFVLLISALLAVGSPSWSNLEQTSFNVEPQTFPGFTLDLNAWRLVEMEGQAPVWMTELDKIHAKSRGIKFFDITDTRDLGTLAHLRTAQQPFSTPKEKELIKTIIKSLSVDPIERLVEQMSSFRTRYYRSDTGKQSQKWLLSKISQVTTESASEALQKIITISEFEHSWGQSTIIARINGSSSIDDGIIVLGAHLDSTNVWPFLPAPGADDDASGTATILEAYRGLLAADFRPVRTLEFHWYSAEEGGLLGSQAVAQDYEARSVNVVAMSHFDQTGWLKKGTQEEIALVTDNTDPGLTKLHMQLVDLYLDIPYVAIECGYACSDHASWDKAGYRAASAHEGTVKNHNPITHSINDRIGYSDELSYPHMLQFSKLSVALAVELAG